jgi:hypothetical protein
MNAGRERPSDVSRARAESARHLRDWVDLTRTEAPAPPQGDLAEVKANLAALNEIVMELVNGASTDVVFREKVRSVLRNHSRKLGFTFQGEH